jgi:hypothetical protein
VVFFSYPPFLKLQRPYKKEKIQIITQDQLGTAACLNFKISESTHTYNCVVNAFKTAGFSMTKGTNWNCLWTGLIR